MIINLIEYYKIKENMRIYFRMLFLATVTLFVSTIFSSCNDKLEDIINETEEDSSSSNNDDEKENDDEIGNGGNIEYRTLNIIASTDKKQTRTSYEEENNIIKAKWEEDDIIYVGYPASGLSEEVAISDASSGFSVFTISSLSDDGKTATFTGQIPADLEGNIMAFYGNAEFIKVSKSGVKLDFTTQGQAISEIADLEGYDFMTASATYSASDENLSLNFSHECAILKINASGFTGGMSLQNMNLSFSDGNAKFCNSVTITVDVNKTYETTDNIVLNLDGTTASAEGKISSYCMLLTNGITATEKLLIDVTAAEGSKKYIYSGNISINSDIVANKYYSTPDIALTSLSESLSAITLSESMLSISSFQWSSDRKNIIDNSTETYWQSKYKKDQNPNLDATYGVYIDITLSNNTYEYLSFDYATGKANNNVPNHIKIYAGADKSNLKELAEYKRTEENLPTAVQTWFIGDDKSKLPIIPLNGINAKVIRVSFLSSYIVDNGIVNDLTDTSHNITTGDSNHPAVTVSELKIYGK